MVHENDDQLRPRVMYCPNCREQLWGLEDNEGIMRMTCKKCGTVLVSKHMGRRHDRIDLFPPKGQERI